jgi:hypothetical protein
MNLYDFLSSQRSDVLFWYGVFILIALAIIVAGIQGILNSFFNRYKPTKNKKRIENDD